MGDQISHILSYFAATGSGPCPWPTFLGSMPRVGNNGGVAWQSRTRHVLRPNRNSAGSSTHAGWLELAPGAPGVEWAVPSGHASRSQ